MSSLTPRTLAAALLLRVHARFIQEIELSAEPAVVFAPHPDDETLGCGGTILRKRRAGADVHIVFMTDGSASHPGGASPAALARARRGEAEAAARELNVRRGSLTFLGCPDTLLWKSSSAAIIEVERLLQACRPREVFIPYQADFNADHQAANHIVRAAIEQALKNGGLQGGVVVYEYPVWFWSHWPWVGLAPEGLPGGRGARAKAVLKQSARAWTSLALFRRFHHAVRVEDDLAQKWRALEQHRSQMEAPAGFPGWPTLPEIARGAFLSRFFQPSELFYRYSLQA